jgi:hypothetical protein
MKKGTEMNSFKTIVLAAICAAVSLTTLHAQTPAPQRPRAASAERLAHSKPGQTMPSAFRGFRMAPSGPLRFLASEEGRKFLQDVGHPIAPYAIQAFGEPSKATVVPAAWYQEFKAEQQSEAAEAAGTTPCNGIAGARFNLEPRANAVPQNEANADFLLNRIAAGEDLIVQAANDWRGNLAPSAHWDQNVSGYYVHRKAGGCTVDFEGGLPTFSYQGNTEMGIGQTVVAADPERDAFFMADVRFSSTGGVGLFRAAASALLSTTQCANGTHTLAKATSCWATATPPQLLFPQPNFDVVADQPQIAVDERATGAGTGAGDVYAVNAEFSFADQTTTVLLTPCTNSLNCGQPLLISGASIQAGFPYVKVRTDGLITVSYLNGNSDGSATIFFVTCTPGGAPNPPTCGAPVTVTQITNPLTPNINTLEPLLNINLLAETFPQHANRTNSGGNFTTFLLYDDCLNPFNPPLCIDAQVLMTTSTNNGQTWSTPVSVDTVAGHHFYPSITTDASTGIVDLAYYSTEGDTFNHEVQVWRNQILPGTTKVGTPQMVTTILDPIDSDPQDLGLLQSDLYMGAIARGNGTAGQSRFYTSFDSTTVSGTYKARPDPELNNHISVFSY